MNYNVENNKLTIYLEGRVDTLNSSVIEQEINKIREENSDGDLVLDCEKLSYISSSGLRIILNLKKKNPTLSIINVSVDVYDIFEMTGFTEMIDIKKAYRKISVDGCEIIGEGANGTVYRYSPEIVVKMYKNPDSLAEIQKERDLAKKAFVLGIPTAISFDIAKIDDHYATVFELLNAKSFAKIIATEPERLDECVDRSVELLKRIHSTFPKDGDMPSIKIKGVSWAEKALPLLPSDVGIKLLRMFYGIREDKNMLHGDYHVKNIMQQGDEVLLIDMDTLCVGNKVFEFAAIYNAYYLFVEPNKDNGYSFLGIDYKVCYEFLDKLMKKYFNTLNDEELQKVKDKALLVGSTRLLRRTAEKIGLDTEEGKRLAEFYKSIILEKIDKVDDLNIDY